jgi:hypothetical protein
MKNRIKYLIFFAFFVILCSSSCNKSEWYKYIYVKNDSSKQVYFGLSYSYPDTSLIKIGFFPGQNGSVANKIKPGKQDFMRASNFVYNPTMQLFIFDADVIENEPKDSIVAHYKVLKRYQFTESDIEKVNWTITYP